VALQVQNGLRRRLDNTGIGFAGVDGVWWRPACEPFELSKQVAQQLEAIGPALFSFFDVVVDSYRRGSSRRLMELLEFKVPKHIPRFVAGGRVESLRPDFQLCPVDGDDSSYQLMVTELEICPSAHGFAHAMQTAYGLATDLADGFVRYLAGRCFLFAGTQAWSEFLFEQLAFCRALEDAGGTGRVLYDVPLTVLAKEVRQGERWQPPIFGIPSKPQNWNGDIIGRVRSHHLEQFMWPDDQEWPSDVDDTVVFRFGYFDCFSETRLRNFQQWQLNGAKSLNPNIYFLENKTLMAALELPQIRQQLDEKDLSVLDRCIPRTILLTEESSTRIIDEKDDWVVKFAAYDGGDRSWGGRSLEMGRQHTHNSWLETVVDYLALPWPVVAQQAIPTARVDQNYLDDEDKIRLLRDGSTRLRVYFLSDGTSSGAASRRALACGAHVTVSGGDAGVAEGLEAVQARVVFV
jgi:hypothetical protein